MAAITKRDIEDTVWSVLTSFAFSEEEQNTDKERYFLLDKNSAFIKTQTSEKARAEAVAACIEAAFACGAESFLIKLSDKAVFDLLILFGFENILVLDRDTKNTFELYTGEKAFASGSFKEDKTIAVIDIKALTDVCKNGEKADGNDVSKSLVYAEYNAEGVAYDICYNLRVNGCIVEMYSENGDIKSALEYAENVGHSAVIRCYADGRVKIKDLAKNEVIETNISEFLGYYEDVSEDECSSHEHDHHNCDCGHHHN